MGILAAEDSLWNARMFRWCFVPHYNFDDGAACGGLVQGGKGDRSAKSSNLNSELGVLLCVCKCWRLANVYALPLTMVSECNETHNNSLMTQDEIKKPEPEEEEEEEEEPIFVLTDEWKEFFAKSEAKRRLAKKQAKKKGKP
ncbi:Hypothetical predicted protein [Olea europaea subsp. europaea]|uniref:Uncharacterized protein n=1 Tax=Olea europaea subsp. europaea TaxID=158383 RepID=A0A8S0TW90_OLEEU|nr:Hypothetical predicted protein [Olea europaea subsp. europaea]